MRRRRETTTPRRALDFLLTDHYRRGRSRPAGAQVAEQVERRAPRRPPETHLLERCHDRAPAGIGLAVHEPLLVVAQRDEDRRRLPAALHEDRLPAALELPEHTSERLP